MPAYKQLYLDAKKEKEELNEKWESWASEVIHWSHTASVETLFYKQLITAENKPTISNVRDFASEITKLKEEIKTLNKHNEHLSNQLNKSDSRNDEYVEQLEGIMNEKGTEHILGCNAYEKFCQAICELNYDEEWITKLKAENKELIAKNKELNKELEYEADTSFADLTEEIKELKEEIDALQNSILHLESEKDDLEKENNALNTSLAGAREVRKRLDYAIRKLSEETVSRVEHQKLADLLNAEAEKYKVKFMEATGQLEK